MLHVPLAWWTRDIPILSITCSYQALYQRSDRREIIIISNKKRNTNQPCYFLNISTSNNSSEINPIRNAYGTWALFSISISTAGLHNEYPCKKYWKLILFGNHNDFTMSFGLCNAYCIYETVCKLIKGKIIWQQRNKINLFMEYPNWVAHLWWRCSGARRRIILWFLLTQFDFLSWHYKRYCRIQ